MAECAMSPTVPSFDTADRQTYRRVAAVALLLCATFVVDQLLASSAAGRDPCAGQGRSAGTDRGRGAARAIGAGRTAAALEPAVTLQLYSIARVISHTRLMFKQTEEFETQRSMQRRLQ